jgi:hypothetical protein
LGLAGSRVFLFQAPPMLTELGGVSISRSKTSNSPQALSGVVIYPLLETHAVRGLGQTYGLGPRPYLGPGTY